MTVRGVSREVAIADHGVVLTGEPDEDLVSDRSRLRAPQHLGHRGLFGIDEAVEHLAAARAAAPRATFVLTRPH